jgi:hypothetical protein
MPRRGPAEPGSWPASYRAGFGPQAQDERSGHGRLGLTRRADGPRHERGLDGGGNADRSRRSGTSRSELPASNGADYCDSGYYYA